MTTALKKILDIIYIIYIYIYIYIYILYVIMKTMCPHGYHHNGNYTSEHFDSFVRLTENLKLYNYLKLPNKNFFKEQKKS